MSCHAPDDVATPLADAFHAHLDACAQCAAHPFELCAEGAAILEREARRAIAGLTGPAREQLGPKPICPGCQVRSPWEHRCHGSDLCACPACQIPAPPVCTRLHAPPRQHRAGRAAGDGVIPSRDTLVNLTCALGLGRVLGFDLGIGYWPGARIVGSVFFVWIAPLAAEARR